MARTKFRNVTHPSRRLLIGGIAALPALAATSRPATLADLPADAELVGLVHQLEMIDDAIDAAIMVAPDPAEADTRELWRSFDLLCNRIAETPASTACGLVAKARAARCCSGGQDPSSGDDVGQRVAWSLVADVIELGEDTDNEFWG